MTVKFKRVLKYFAVLSQCLSFTSLNVNAKEKEEHLPVEFYGIFSNDIIPHAFVFNVPIFGTCGMNIYGNYVAKLEYAIVTSTYRLTGKKTYFPDSVTNDTGIWDLIIWHEDVQGNQIDFRFENIISEITAQIKILRRKDI